VKIVREQRKRKALYVIRREELYPETLLQKEYAVKKKRGGGKQEPATPPRIPLKAGPYPAR
jgi:hypothetical protein